MLDKNEILFPLNVSNKHPYTKEIIELAEKADIGVSQIAELLNCSQPYVSQLKKGQGNAKVEALAPLISLLSPKLPGNNFSSYMVFKRAIPLIPQDWEQQVLLTGLREKSKSSDFGRYPIGDDGFSKVEQNHQQAISKLDENGRPVNHSNDISLFLENAQKSHSNLKEVLETYEAESKGLNDRITRCNQEIDERIEYAFRHLSGHPNIDKNATEEILRKELARIFEHRIYSREPSPWKTATLVDACREAAHAMKYRPLVKEFREYEYSELSESEWVHAPDEHAKRLLGKLNEFCTKILVIRQNRQDKYRLQNLFKKEALANLKKLSIAYPQNTPDWAHFGDELFGNCVREIFGNSNSIPYKVNMTEAFAAWAKTIKFDVQEEVVQICGNKLHAQNFSNCSLVIHELPSQKFVYLITFNCEFLEKEVTLLSEPLPVLTLLERLEAEAKLLSWDNEIGKLLDEVKNKLISAGYRVTGVRAIY